MVESGWFYKSFIDPLLVSGRKKIVAEINHGETVLDVACGTGALVFEGAQRAKKIVGVDLSDSMIKSAQKEKRKQQIKNTAFEIGDATNLTAFKKNEFDVIILSMALHQFNPKFYTSILNELKRVGKTMIIVDYSVPLPKNIIGLSAKLIEFLAGKEHNRNFRKYYKLKGLDSILPKNRLKIESSEYFSSGIFQLIKCIPE